MQEPSFNLSSGNAVYITGNGEPLVIIGGGPGLSSRVYRKYLVPLIENHQVIRWDYAALGASLPRSEVSFENDYEDFLGLLKHLNLNSVKLLGHSYGGLLALKYASESPAAVSHLALLNTAPAFLPVLMDGMERKMARLNPQDQQKLADLFERMEAGTTTSEDLQTFVRLEVECELFQPTSEQIQETILNIDFDLNVLVNNADWAIVDLTSQLNKIRAKTWIAMGKHDINVPAEFSDSLMAISNATSTVFQNSAHWPQNEEPELFQRQLNAFLRG